MLVAYTEVSVRVLSFLYMVITLKESTLVYLLLAGTCHVLTSPFSATEEYRTSVYPQQFGLLVLFGVFGR